MNAQASTSALTASTSNNDGVDAHQYGSLTSLVLRPHDQRNEHDIDKSLTVVDDDSGKRYRSKEEADFY